MHKRILVSFLFILFCLGSAFCQSTGDRIELPAPDKTGGKPLMQALSERHSSRAFSETLLPAQVLSNLCWAGFGINREDGRRTAPSARNWQEFSLYLVMAEGVYLYNPVEHALLRLLTEDLRSLSGVQEFVGKAPLNIVYVADMNKVKASSADDASIYLGADCGFIAANVYLYCASEGLAVVVRGLVPREKLAAALQLQPHQRIVLAQTVGYPQQ